MCSNSYTAQTLVHSVEDLQKLELTNPGTYTADTALTNALASAASYAASFTGASIEGSGPITGRSNLTQGAIFFPAGQLCAITQPILVPVGTPVRGNGSVLVQTGKGDALQFEAIVPGTSTSTTGYNHPNNLSARVHDEVTDLIIEGPGSNTTASASGVVSSGSGIREEIGINWFFSNVKIFGMHHGFEIDTSEYGMCVNCWAAHNNKGLVLTYGLDRNNNSATQLANQYGASGPSIDNVFLGGGFERNDSEGIWNYISTAVRFYGTSLSNNGDLSVVLGAQPAPYLNEKAYTVTTPGAGCTATNTSASGPSATSGTSAVQAMLTAEGITGATIAIAPLTYSDPDPAGTGSGAQGFAVINTSSGAVMSAWGTRPGANYGSSTTASVAGCTTIPVITPTITDLTAGETQVLTNSANGSGSASDFVLFATPDIETEGIADTGIPNKPSYGSVVYEDVNHKTATFDTPGWVRASDAVEYTQFLTTYNGADEIHNLLATPATNPLTGETGLVTVAGGAGAGIPDNVERSGQLCLPASSATAVQNPIGNSHTFGIFQNAFSSGSGYIGWGLNEFASVFRGRLYAPATKHGALLPALLATFRRLPSTTAAATPQERNYCRAALIRCIETGAGPASTVIPRVATA